MLTTDLDVEKSADDIAEQVEKIAGALERLQASRLTPKAVYLLLSHASGVSQKDIKKVLDAAAALRKQYLKPRAVKVG
jgi:RNase H-fold protein (predicted Holliday junction resolvase)